MNQYHKINSIYKRDEKGKFLIGQFSDPEVEYLNDPHEDEVTFTWQ